MTVRPDPYQRFHEAIASLTEELLVDDYTKQSDIHTTMSMSDGVRVASTGYMGVNDHKDRLDENVGLADLIGSDSYLGFRYVNWDGVTTRKLISADGYICGILGGQPSVHNWTVLQKSACKASKNARKQCRPKAQDVDHRRGAFTTLRGGVLHGNGTTEPVAAHNTPKNQEILESLNDLTVFKELAKFATSIMASHAPALWKYYSNCLSALHQKRPHLPELFQGSVFTTTTYNLGPQTICKKHTDFLNLAYGWCAITALGKFDSNKGGHLVLWDLKLVIRFPPGSTVLIPSAIIAHSNIPVGPREKRYSFTQYTPAGVFQWVENGFRTRESMSKAEKRAMKTVDAQRWAFGLSLTPRHIL